MSLNLFKLFFILFLITNSISLRAQKQGKEKILGMDKNIFSTLQDQVFKKFNLLDTYHSSNFDEKGTFFIKFSFQQNKIVNIKITVDAPDFMEEALRQFLEEITAGQLFPSQKLKKNEIYILPIKYDYRNGKRSKDIKDLEAKLSSAIKASQSNKKSSFEDFNLLFELSDSEAHGFNCVLLNPLEINKPIE